MSTVGAVESWDVLRIIHLIATVVTPGFLAWIMMNANDRRKAMDARLEGMDENLRGKMLNIETQLREMKGEMRDGRKECSEDVRAIIAQMSEYPRRRELQEGMSELWRSIRTPRSGE
jgi:hypothetical protein